MSHTTEPFTFTVQLAWKAHHFAKQFRQQQSNFHNAQQVYLNTLAVYAVNVYLQLNGFETNLKKSDSWEPVMQSLADVADLEVKNLGKLECRYVFSDTQMVYIPAEVWEDRIGYVIVRMNESLTEATLLGFAKKVAIEEMPISQLQSLKDFLEYLNQIQKPEPKIIVNLNQWFQNVFEAGWQTAEEFFGPPEVSLAFRNANSERVTLAKPVQLGIKPADCSIAMVLNLTKEATQETRIRVQVRSLGENIFLPEGLKLLVLDEAGTTFLESSAGSTNTLIQTEQFSGQPGEKFKVEVLLGEDTVIEDFVI
jgi:hypothetical protein